MIVKTMCPNCKGNNIYEDRSVGIRKPSSFASISYLLKCKDCGQIFNNSSWTDEDINKMKSAYLEGKRETECPICYRKVSIIKEEGEEHLKKKYVNTHFFLKYQCEGCGREDVREYRKRP